MNAPQTPSWQFFRAGGFDQVQLRSAKDLAALPQLDQKLWATLACPTVNLAADARMLGYMDGNADGRIRAPEVLAAVDWALQRLADPELLFSGAPLQLASFSTNAEGRQLALAAERLLSIVGRDAQQTLSAADTDDLSALFPAHRANGDGLVPAALTDDAELKQCIADIITCMGAETDRSGEPAVSEASVKAFFAQIKAVVEWLRSVDADALQPFGATTTAAVEAIAALREKIDDYFTRVDMAAFDPRAAAIMNGEESELVRLAGISLADTQQLAALPLAGLQHGDALPLDLGVNPAWKSRLQALRESAVLPLFGDVSVLSRQRWQQLLSRSQAYFAWQQRRPALAVLQHLDYARILTLSAGDAESRLLALIEHDKAVADAAAGLVDLDKLLRYQRGLLPLLRNFVSFQDFYGRQDKAVFQAGRLFIDGKSCDLVVQVDDIAAHSAVASSSNSFLIYCNCQRRGQPVRGKDSIHIVAAITAGADHALTVGRNGLFYDRDGNDWDATVVKIVENAISVRQAFWSPYRRVANLISEQVQKFAASRDSAVVDQTASGVGSAGAAPEQASSAAKAFDIGRFAGIFAAIGLAVGAVGTAFAAIFSGLLALQLWQWPLVVLGLLTLISGPSMLMAWFKLRRRSLGPILDAGGWAVNSQARISIGFGASLTQLASLPSGASRDLRDPYASRRPLWPWLLLAAVVIGSAAWLWHRAQPAADAPVAEVAEPAAAAKP